jgi:hypothetical protein
MAGLTPEEEMANSIPVDVIYQAPPPVPLDFIIGDTVQLRREVDGEPLETAVGVVSLVEVTALTLGSRIYDMLDEWEYALVKRELALPVTLSEIEATLFNGSVVRLMGRGVMWMDEIGSPVVAAEIQSFTLL